MSEQQLLSRIAIDPAICHGKPCIRGLRYPVETILELLTSGISFEEILAVLAYATRLSRVGHIEPVAA